MVLSGISGILLGMMVQKNSLPLNIHEETWALNLAGSYPMTPRGAGLRMKSAVRKTGGAEEGLLSI